MMTPEELDKARAEEAVRLWDAQKTPYPDIAEIAARLAREGWQPAVDLLVEALREMDPDEIANETDADNLRQALASRGLQIVEIVREDKSDERRGIERVAMWQDAMGDPAHAARMRRDLLGEN